VPGRGRIPEQLVALTNPPSSGERAELTLLIAESARPALRLVALRILD
jgi:hypothetical protein